MENLVTRQQLSTYYQGKKVFLTGHTGFKGSWLAAWLHSLGATVKGYALAPEYGNGLYSLLPATVFAGGDIHADIMDRQRLRDELLAFAPDFVFHLAAQPLVRRSYQMPADTFAINAVGTANLLEAVHQLPGHCTVLVITTDKVYENKEQDVLYKEGDTLGGYDPYSASKACTELVVNSFRNSFFNPAAFAQHGKQLASVRAGNVIGGGDWSQDRIVPDIVRSLQAARPIHVRNPAAVRPWQHVLEPLGGYLLLGGLLASGATKLSPAYNFGPQPHDHLPVGQLVQQAIANWGNGEWVNASDKSQPHEAGLLQLDITLADKELHWQPKLTAAEAIAWTLQWYRQPVADQAAFALEQIQNYQAL
jgi:CDP-glucose 4,6-dehydratase